MSFGITILSPTGTVWMDSTLITWNLVQAYQVDAGATDSRSFPELVGREFMAVQIPLEVPKVNDYTYEKSISVSGNNVTVSGGNQIALIVVLCR